MAFSPSTDIPPGHFDIETASAPQLLLALKMQNQQYDELASYYGSDESEEETFCFGERSCQEKDRG
jgi:hypothetical protein